MRLLCLLLPAAFLAATPVLADGDAVAGKALFSKCSACHAIDAPTNKIGPHLVGIVGRKAASVADYTKYSDGMKKAGADGVVWDEASLTKYLHAPKEMVPGTKMALAGLKTPEEIANMVAFLKTHP